MGKLDMSFHSEKFKNLVFGLSRSYLNSVKLFSIDKTFSVRPDNNSMVYEAAISYYNVGFAKETGEIKQPKKIIEDYKNLITLMFSKEFSQERAIVTVDDVQVQDALVDYSLFLLYAILINFKNIRVAIWEDFQNNGTEMLSLFNVIYNTAEKELSGFNKTKLQLPQGKWIRVASNIVLNVKQQWELLDK